MKRGAIEISQELLKELLKDKIPDDFLLSGTELIPTSNSVKLHGYSEQFHEVIEGNHHMVESINPFFSSDIPSWQKEPEINQANLIRLSKELNLVTVYDENGRELTITVVPTGLNNCNPIFKIKATIPTL